MKLDSFNAHLWGALAALAAALCVIQAQPSSGGATASRPHTRRDALRSSAADDYASNIGVVRDAQEQALEQARQMLERAEGPDRTALETAIRQMERSQASLEEARTTPAQLPAAIAAQEAAYQALLKLLPREHRVSRSRNGGQNSGAGQPNRRELDQLEMTGEENRYETERQATATPDAQQQARGQAADRLKQLAQRQQDINDRLRELQTALQEARTDQQREEIRRELKRLQDEERRMLADLDELRQRLEQSSDPSASAEIRRQLDQTRSDMQRAAEGLDREAASQALAAGARAQESLQQLRDDLRQSSASQLSEQMRQLRSQARELAGQQEQLAQQLDSLANAGRKALDISAERQGLTHQIARQQSRLTNLLAGVRATTEQAENIEPLLSQQLYDALRRADQSHTDNLLDTTAELVDRGFLPQAGEAERAARQNIQELRQSVERAAESVLGSEADALRYARSELENLTRQVEREIPEASTNAPGLSSPGAGSGTNSLARNAGEAPGEPGGVQPGNEAGRDPDRSGRGQPGNQTGRDSDRPGRGQADQQAGSNGATGQNPGSNGGGDRSEGDDSLRQFTEQLGRATGGDASGGGPITGNNYGNWADRMREVEQVLDSTDLRNQLATARERVGAFRNAYREYGHAPAPDAVRNQILTPMTQVRVWLQEEMARLDNAGSLVPLDRDPVPEKFSELVRRYYETLGGGSSE